MNSEVNKKKLAAQVLRNRALDKLDQSKSPEELEIDKLFFWILSVAGQKVEEYNLPSRYCSIIIKEIAHGHKSGVIILQYTDQIDNRFVEEPKYYSTYVKGEKFYEIMMKVANIFYELDGFDGKYISSNCGEAEMRIKIKRSR